MSQQADFYEPLDLHGYEAKNFVLQQLTAPPANLTPYHNLNTGLDMWYQNGAWTNIPVNAATKTAPASAGGVSQVSGGADRTLVDYSAGAGLMKANAAGVVSPAVVGVDYSTPTSPDTLANKIINAINNAISNISLAMFAAGAITTDGSGAVNSDAVLLTAKATFTAIANSIQGIKWKTPVRLATLVAGTLATSFANGQVVDGVTLVTGDRILLMGQSNGYDNGVYIVNASGVPTRTVDANTGALIQNMVATALEGTANADESFINTNIGAAPTLGSTVLTFTNFVSANVPMASQTIAGKSAYATPAETFARLIGNKSVVPSGLVGFARTYSQIFGDAVSTSFTITHNLGTQAIKVGFRDTTTLADVFINNTAPTNNTVLVSFPPSPNGSQYVPASNAFLITVLAAS